MKNDKFLSNLVVFWRKRWDSNPRAREDYLISSQGRYDHFDTLPYGFVWLSENFRYTVAGPLCPVAVPKICCSLTHRQILTAATPFCSLHPPPAALANVPTSIRFHIQPYYHTTLQRNMQVFFESFRKKERSAAGDGKEVVP